MSPCGQQVTGLKRLDDYGIALVASDSHKRTQRWKPPQEGYVSNRKLPPNYLRKLLVQQLPRNLTFTAAV